MAEANAIETPPLPEAAPVAHDSKGRKIVPRREFDEDFKRKAVARAKKWTGTTTTLANQLHIHPTVLRRWMTGDLGKTSTAKPTKVQGVSVTRLGTRMYSEAYKRKAVERWNKGKETGTAISKDLKISSSMLSAWRAKYSPETKRASPKKSTLKHPLPTSANPAVSRFSREYKMEILARVAKGERITDIAKEIGTSVSGIDYWRRTLGGKIPRTYMKNRGKEAHAVANALGVPFDSKGGIITPVPVNVRDAISFLRHAKDKMHTALQHGLIKEFDQAHLLSLMALNELTK
jgi:transposase-like protein